MTGVRRVFVALVVFSLAVIVADLGISRTRVAWDLTAEHSGTLSDETIRVLHAVKRRVQITAFYGRDTLGRVEASTLLERYHRVNRRITFRILDPSVAPGELKRLGVASEGSAGIEDLSRSGKVEVAQFVIEIDVTSAIARLLRNSHGTVCFTSGHGERSATGADPSGFSSASDILRDNAYRIRTIDLLAAASIPKTCDALVIASPTTRFDDASRTAVVRYLRRTGKALLLGDADADADLTPLARPWGLQFVRGVVVEASDGAHLPNDFTSPIVTNYFASSPAVRGLGPTFFPRTQAIRTHNVSDPGTTVSAVAITTKLAYLDRGDLGTFDETVDVAGPIVVGAAADDSAVVGAGTKRARVVRTRILAWGDADFASNAFIGDGSNARLWIQGIDWLAQPEDLVTAVPNFPKVRELKLTSARSRYMLFLMAGFVPGLFLLAGAFVWVLRRSR
jgi:hypothetical protein